MTSIDPYTVGADSISARGSMRQRKPRGGVKTAWRRTTSAASQQSWPAHAVVCPAGANIVRSPVSLRSTVVPRLQPRTSLRFAVHGCHVGSGLDRSGNLPSGSPFPGAAHVGAAYMRPAGVRKTGARGPGRGPGMPGPYRVADTGCPEGSRPLGGAQRAPPASKAGPLMRLFAPQGQTLFAPRFRYAQPWSHAYNPAPPYDSPFTGAM